MGPLPRFTQLVNRAPGHDLAAMADKALEDLLKIQYPRLALYQGHHVDAEDCLQLGVLVDIIEHHLAHLAPAQLDDHAHAVFVGFITELTDPFEFFLLHKLCDPLHQPGFIDLIGQLSDDDALAFLLAIGFNYGPRPDVNTPSPGTVSLVDPLGTIDDPGGGEIGSRDVLNDLIDIQIRLIDQGDTGVYYLCEIMRWDIGGHAHGNATGTIDQ